MRVRETCFVILVLIIAVVATSPAAAQRQAALRDAGGETLTPQEDGTYFLPIPGMESAVLRFEPGDMPIELVALRIGESGDSLIADLRYTGEKVVTGWQVKTGSVRTDGRETSSATRGFDWGASGDPRMDSPPGYRYIGGALDDEGPIQPGEVRSVDLGSANGPDLAELVLSVPLLIFEDTSYLGSARNARDMLENRSMEAEEMARWLERMAAILESSSGDWELSRALAELITEMEQVPDVPLRPGPSWVRKAYIRDLRDIVEADRSSKNRLTKRERVQELITIDRRRLEAKVEHVPQELPVDDGPPRKFHTKIFDEGPGGDPVDDPDLDCDCGGSIRDNVARNEAMLCGVSRGWTINEDWDIDCLNEAGDKIDDRDGKLTGFGGCSVDNFCFDTKFCPPEFQPPDIYDDEGTRYWHRSVRNQEALYGLCLTSVRCNYVDPANSLLLTCDCAPMPRPRCYADGCPILIETGGGGFSLTGMADGVTFDLTGHGIPSRVAWTRPGGDDAWLVLDRNGNGRIDDATELFGDRTDQPPSDEPHGFLALAVFDDPAHGGDGDGVISAADAVFPDLRLWLDHDHDGVTDLGELVPLASADIAAIELDFFRAERRDNFGNRFRYSAKVHLASGGHRLATDVFLQFE